MGKSMRFAEGVGNLVVCRGRRKPGDFHFFLTLWKQSLKSGSLNMS